MKLVVIDGNALVNRSFYAIKALSTREGMPTNAVYGFVSIVEKILEEEQPDGICVAFDLKDPTFRHLAYEGYKAQRKGMPEELAVQMPLVKEYLDAMNIPYFEQSGYEADDLIGTIAARCSAASWDTLIVTGDKDALQLVSGQVHVSLITSRAGRTTTREITPEIVWEEYGFEPRRMVDFKALMGDPSDNIPGVPGIGEKTAAQLLRTFGTLENLYENLDSPEIKPGVRKRLREGGEMARMSYRLAAIDQAVPMEFSPEAQLRALPDRGKLYAFFLRLEFHKFIQKMGLAPEENHGRRSDAAAQKRDRKIISEGAQAEALLAVLEKGTQVFLYSLRDFSEFCFMAEETVYFLHKELPTEEYDAVLRELFSARVPKVTHGAKELMGHLRASGLPTDGFVFDTAIAAYLLSPTDGDYALEALAESYLGRTRQPKKPEARGESGTDAGTDSEIEDELFASVCELEALHSVFSDKLSEFALRELHDEIELPLCPVLAEMEEAGILIDRDALLAFGKTLSARIEAVAAEVFALSDGPFNILSPQQLGLVLFEKLGLPAHKKTKTGHSTNAEVLEKLRFSHPIVPLVLEYRQLTKLKSTYVDGLLRAASPNGRVHTRFQNTATATGRLSSIEPNLQNIPIRTDLGAFLRTVFVAPEGKRLVGADYSQIELRLLAHISGDQAMQEAFLDGIDIHTVTASQVFATAECDVTPLQRARAKAVNFGIVYGISEFSLAQDIGVPQWEAKEYMEAYFRTYPKVRAYMGRIVEEAKRDGFVSTRYGRRRALPELKSRNHNLRAFGERVALNMPIQGTAADLIKIAMIRVAARLRGAGLSAQILLQVHDELIVECPIEETELVKLILREEMENAASLSVPLAVAVWSGKSWAEAK